MENIMSKKRYANIELGRVIACFIVICLHTITWYTYKGKLLENSLLIRSFLTDGVPIFWYIMGYFLFINPNVTLKKRLKKTTKSLLIPAFVVMLISQIWQDWILAGAGEVNFLACLDMHSFDAENLFKNILAWKSNMTFGGHLWYIFSYLQVILWTPLLRFICVNTPKANRCRRYLMVLCALQIIVKDLNNLPFVNELGIYPITVYSVLSTTLLFILIGYETYLHKDRIFNHATLFRFLGLGMFVIFNLVKYSHAVQDMRINTKDDYFLGSNISMAYLASYGLFLFVLSLKFKPDSKLETVVQFLGSKTLGIYLIHGLVFRKLKALGIRDWVYTLYTKHPDHLLVEIACTLLYALLVFAVCLLIVCILSGIFKGLKMLCKLIRRKKTALPEKVAG